MEGNASVYQVNPVSRITGEGRVEFLRTWGPGLDQEGAVGGGGGGGTGRVAQFVRENCKLFKGIHVKTNKSYRLYIYIYIYMSP